MKTTLIAAAVAGSGSSVLTALLVDSGLAFASGFVLMALGSLALGLVCLASAY